MKHHCPHNDTNRGMTLIEVTMVISMLVVVGVVLNTNILSFYRNNAFLLEETEALNGAHQGVNRFIRDIREASYGADGSYPVASAATSSITIYSDIDSDTAVERITYTLSGTTFFRAITNSAGSPATYVGQPISTTTLVTSVRNASTTPLFTYFDSSGLQLSTSTTPLARIAAIKISILVDLNPLRAPNVFTLSQYATLRNIRTQ